MKGAYTLKKLLCGNMCGASLYLMSCVCCVVSCRQLCVVSGEKAKVEKYSSVGLDGAMVIWDFKVHVSNFNTKMKL